MFEQEAEKEDAATPGRVRPAHGHLEKGDPAILSCVGGLHAAKSAVDLLLAHAGVFSSHRHLFSLVALKLSRDNTEQET